ncbi:MAG: DUF177 domain-containing protein [Alphaproteobacteria bacterium]|nr:MAG: DUF177 domain-containing protein [Alphaproteobacteria bacterium]
MAGFLGQQIDLRQLPKMAKTLMLSATAEDCKTLEQSLHLRGVGSVSATLSIERLGKRRGIMVSGSLQADIVQACVITLVDVPAKIDAHIAVRFVDEERNTEALTLDVEPGGEDVEYFSGDYIDLSEVLVQYMALEMDHYPRATGVSEDAEFVYSTATAEELAADEKPRPFAELKKLQDKT